MFRRPNWRVLPLLLLLGLQACGFQPLYANRSGAIVTQTLAAIEIGLIRDRTGQLLRSEEHTSELQSH